MLTIIFKRLFAQLPEIKREEDYIRIFPLPPKFYMKGLIFNKLNKRKEVENENVANK